MPDASAGASGTRAATLCGIVAIVLWGALAVMAKLSGPIPPFQMTAMSFLVAGLLGFAIAAMRGTLALTRPTAASFGLGLYGLFLYHAMYFGAISLAPPAQAHLVNSLWALFIVLLAGLLPSHRLRAAHLVGAALGLLAALMLVWPELGRARDGVTGSVLLGYGLALGCALVWSSYSVASRLVAAVATESLAVTCLATAALAALCHLVFETTVIPATALQWLAIVGSGIGPVGAAFYLWDIGMKRGDVSLLGVLAYGAPVLATILLVLAGFTVPSVTLGVACLLIVTGGVIAARA